MIYLDHHATTPLDPVALEAMLPFFSEQFANAGSITHAAGRKIQQAVAEATAQLARDLGASTEEVVITSGATESNNLALLGFCLHPRQKRRKLISVGTEHRATLDPLQRLSKSGFEITFVPVQSQSATLPGMVDLDQLAAALDEQTALVSLMLANNEIGVIQPVSEVAKLCRDHGAVLHTDASQAVGRIPVDVNELDVDLLSFSAHKFYGPKGVGGLFVREHGRRIRLQAQILGGGQQGNRRSGTLNVPGIVGMQAALASCLRDLEQDQKRIRALRDDLYAQLCSTIPGMQLNGPGWEQDSLVRLNGNLNCCFMPIEGQSLMAAAPELAISSGSACTAAEPTPSHVLMALGLTEEHARSSLRFGVGRFNTQSDIDRTTHMLGQAYAELSEFRST